METTSFTDQDPFVPKRVGVGPSMRAVAGELDMGTMSLYRYVEGREHLEALVVNLVLQSVDLDVTECTSWAQRASLLASRFRNAVSAHPSVVPLLLVRRHSSENALRWAEALLKVLADAGFAGEERVVAFRTLVSYLRGAVQAEHLGPLAGAGTAALSELPRTTYPYIAETAVSARNVAPDAEFLSGLQVVLRGLAKGMSSARASRRR